MNAQEKIEQVRENVTPDKAKALAHRLTDQFEAEGVDQNLAFVALTIMVSAMSAQIIRSSPRYEVPGYFDFKKAELLDLISNTIDTARGHFDALATDGEIVGAFGVLRDRVAGAEQPLPPV